MGKSVSIYLIKPNFTRVDIGPLTIWFSYKTPIAFRVLGSSLVIRQNDWSTTTGKHLNEINDDKTIRIPGAQFEHQLENAVNGI